MKLKNLIFLASLILVSLSIAALVGGETAMADAILYRASLANNKARTVTLKKRGENLIVLLEGFADKPFELKADGGGTSTCRTTVEHNSKDATVFLSLGMPDTRARCAMLPSFITIETNSISVDEETLKKISGNNSNVRSTVQKVLGIIEEGES